MTRYSRMLKSDLEERDECDYRGCCICRQQGMKVGQEPTANWVDANGLYMCDEHMKSHGGDKVDDGGRTRIGNTPTCEDCDQPIDHCTCGDDDSTIPNLSPLDQHQTDCVCHECKPDKPLTPTIEDIETGWDWLERTIGRVSVQDMRGDDRDEALALLDRLHSSLDVDADKTV